MMSRRSFRRRLASIAVVAALALTATGIAVATIPDSNTGVITGCHNQLTGGLRVIDAQAGAKCSVGEKELSWNQIGPQGPQGPAGTSATASISNIYGRIGTVAPDTTPLAFKFAGPTATITTTAGQTVVASISGVIGSGVGGRVAFGVCYANRVSTPVRPPFISFLETVLRPDEQEVVNTTASAQLPAGSYDVGFCLWPRTSLDRNDYVQGTISVFN